MAIIGMDGQVIAPTEVEDKIEVSEKTMAMMGLMLTAEMLYTYAVQQVSVECSDQVELVRGEVSAELKKMEQFNLNDLKFRTLDALQTVMSALSAVYMEASIKAAMSDKPAAEANDSVPETPAVEEPGSAQ